ncbi:hypothetical protein C7405_101545 [Paraburkholderia caballeronis]|nr:hypothetical protein C7405_101545 [Paraburkholderia caballeronis]
MSGRFLSSHVRAAASSCATCGFIGADGGVGADGAGFAAAAPGVGEAAGFGAG